MSSKQAILRDSRVDLSKSTRRYTDEGYLIVDALIARTGIQEYQGFELPDKTLDSNRTYRIYRPASEVFKKETLKSFRQKPVTNEHPYDEGGWLTADTATKKLVGVSGDNVSRAGENIKVTLTIYAADTIADIENGKVGLSAGYKCKVLMTPGKTPRSEHYDGIQTDIFGNHTAICDVNDARGGRGCRLLDKKTKRTLDMRKNPMGDEQKENAGINYPDLSDMNQLGQMIQEMGKAIKDGFSNILGALKTDDEDYENDSGDEAEPEDEDRLPVKSTDEDNEDDESQNEGKQEEPPRKSISGKTTDKKLKNNFVKSAVTDSRQLTLMRLTKEVDYLKGQLAVAKKSVINDKHINKIVSARVKLINEAQQVLPDQDLNVMDSLTIKKAVIKQVMPDITLDSTPAFIDGVYQSCVNVFLKGGNSSDRLAGAIMDSYSNLDVSSEELKVLDSGQMSENGRQKMVERNRNAWKGSQNKEGK